MLTMKKNLLLSGFALGLLALASPGCSSPPPPPPTPPPATTIQKTTTTHEDTTRTISSEPVPGQPVSPH